MNEEFELRKRISDADPGRDAPELNQSVVARAALGKPRRQFGFRGLRVAVGSASVAVTAIALAITLPAVMTPAPLFTVASSSTGGERLSSSADSSAGMDESSMFWPGWSSYEYTAGSALSDETGSGQVYQGKLVGDPLEILKQLGVIFGIAGEPVRDEWSDENYPSYSITEANAYLNIYWSGTGSWSFSNWTDNQYGCSEDVTKKIDEEFVYCEPKPTPELIPPVQQLKAEAEKLLDQMGIDFQSSSITISRGDWGAYAWLPYLTDGIETGLQTYLNWGMDGKLSYFSSHNVELVARGSFDTVSAVDAVSRVSEGRWYGSPPESFYRALDGGPTFDSSVSRASSTPVEETKDGSIDQPMPIEDPDQNYEPEILKLTIERSEVTMLSVWDSAGNYWLVPGYVLFNDQGWFDSVISLEEGVIELPEPMVMLPMDVIREDPAVSEMVD
jgi:hypothetical protein